MKATNHFTRTILTYLEKRAETDALFAQSFANPAKDIDSCVTYILNTVQKSGCNGFADEEIYTMAGDYYNTDTIEIGNPVNNCRISVNHVVELTAEEVEEAKKEAIRKIHNDTYDRMMQPKKRIAPKAIAETNNQPGLFDF
ncbi:PcfK-like family protein [Dysgonomonas macrotermitis]|uniref:PcfK-like protein n=1 Tax=Dysgonomonas macrotermitis TaxID=1346286 RepID=A0A1M5IIV6_9BACT|nr:PcfK-like family protein [Dysgonomonas macrotermitis]SHG28197.1 PcfK-like protein [Dysgonomonas macrotermitis]